MTCRKCKRETPPEALYCPFCGVSLKPREYTHKPRTRPNGAGTAFKRGKTWYAQVTIGYKPTGDTEKPRKQGIRATKGGFSTKREALDYCKQLKTEATNKKPERVMLTVREIYDLWLPTHEVKVGRDAMNCYKSAFKYYAAIQDYKMCDVDIDDLQECVNNCPRGKRVKENMKIVASLLYKYAVPRHQTDMNYATFLTTGRDKKGTRPALTKEHIELIRQQVGKTPHAEDVLCLIYTGFRPAELLQLKKDDFMDGVLYGGIKTEAGKNRAVPVSQKIMPYIIQKMQNNSIYLFPKDDGTQMSLEYFRDNTFYPVLAAAGIQPIPSPGHPAYYVPYSCRHTFANLLKVVPGSDKDKAGLIGHEDYQTTKKHYQSVELYALKQIIDAL